MDIEDLVDKHGGSAAFILGGGPSIRQQDLSPLDGHVTIAVNSGILACPDPTYFLSDDIGVKNWSYYLYDLPKSRCTKLLYYEKLRQNWGHLDKLEIIWFHHKWWYDPKNKTHNPDGLVMRKDDFRIIGARSSIGSAVHFAFIMGCDPIVLIGCDCSYNKASEGKPRRYFWQYWPKEKQPYRVTKEPVFSTPNKGIREGYYVDSHSLDFIDYWAALARQCEKQHVRVINASGGLLEAFPRMTLPKVLALCKGGSYDSNSKQETQEQKEGSAYSIRGRPSQGDGAQACDGRPGVCS